MGFSVSGATALILFGMFIAFGVAFTAAANGFELVTEAQDDRDDRALALQNTDIEIDKLEEDNGDLAEVVVNNTGSTALSINESALLTNGTVVERGAYDTSIDGNVEETDLWLPGEQLVIDNFDNEVTTSTPIRVKYVTEYGVADTEVLE